MYIPSFRVLSFQILLLFCLSIPALAVESGVVERSIELSNMKRIGEMTTVGVIATAYIVAVNPAEHAGASHTVVVTFVNEKSKLPLAKGFVGLKHRKLFGDTSEPVWMQSNVEQPELLVADVTLKRRGTYLFIVGSKLEDDKKRQFTFQYQY